MGEMAPEQRAAVAAVLQGALQEQQREAQESRRQDPSNTHYPGFLEWNGKAPAAPDLESATLSLFRWGDPNWQGLSLRVEFQSGGRRVRIEIEDTGIGIRADDADRVFNPFFSTKDGGTGLGLALTHKIVVDHGGSIDFRSASGGGTTFRIELPLFPDPPTGAGTHGDDVR